MNKNEQEENFNLIVEQINNFKDHIENYRMTLNDEAPWLFLSTLACLSINNFFFKIIAFLITIILFIDRTLTKSKERRSFPKIIKNIKAKTEQTLQPSQNKSKATQLLDELIKDKLSVFGHIKGNMLFIICWLYLAITAFYTVLIGQ